MAPWRRSRETVENKPFRDGSYCKRIWVGKRTVKQGECAAIWDDKGTCTLVEGPRRVWTVFSTVRFLTFHRAGKNEYIVVDYKNGGDAARRAERPSDQTRTPPLRACNKCACAMPPSRAQSRPDADRGVSHRTPGYR